MPGDEPSDERPQAGGCVPVGVRFAQGFQRPHVAGPDDLEQQVLLRPEVYVERSRGQAHGGVISLVVVAWYPLDAKQRTPDVSRLLATSPRWLSQSWADRSGRLGGSARSLPGRDTGTPAAHRRPAFRRPQSSLPSPWHQAYGSERTN